MLFVTLCALFCLLTIISIFIPGKSAYAASLSMSAAASPYTLTIDNPGNLISQSLVTQLQAVFDYSYPKLAQRFGSPTVPTNVELTVYSASDGTISGTSDAHVYINAVYQNANPDDLGWFTHELTHVAQSYSGSDVPGWFTEGMAEYGRYYYAPAGANPSWWQIPGTVTASDSYTKGYGPAGRFLIWLQQQKSATIVDQLNHAAQTQQVFLTVFQQITGSTVDQAWAQYVGNPGIRESGVCQAGFQVTYAAHTWPGGFTANLTIQNTGSASVNGWNLAFTFPGTQQETQGANGIFQQQGGTVTITNASYNSLIPVGASAYPNFNGTWVDNYSDPNTFILNGQPCTVAYS